MTPLKEGDKAPYFEGINQDGKKITLDDFKGKKSSIFTRKTTHQDARLKHVV